MKRRAIILVLICVLLASCVTFCACNESECAHVFNLTFSYNEKSHWRTCKDCGYAVEEESHTLKKTVEGARHEGNKVTRTFSESCAVCGYRKEYDIEEIEIPPTDDAITGEFDYFKSAFLSRAEQENKFSVTVQMDFGGEATSTNIWRKQIEPFYYAHSTDNNYWTIYKHFGDNVYEYSVIGYTCTREQYLCPIADYREEHYESIPPISCFDVDYDFTKCALKKDGVCKYSVTALVKDGMGEWIQTYIESVASMMRLDKEFVGNAVATTTYKFEDNKAEVKVELDLLKGTGDSFKCEIKLVYDFEDFELLQTSLKSNENPPSQN